MSIYDSVDLCMISVTKMFWDFASASKMIVMAHSYSFMHTGRYETERKKKGNV